MRGAELDPWTVAVTIPARDEAERIGACLDSVAAALEGRGGVVVMVEVDE